MLPYNGYTIPQAVTLPTAPPIMQMPRGSILPNQMSPGFTTAAYTAYMPTMVSGLPTRVSMALPSMGTMDQAFVIAEATEPRLVTRETIDARLTARALNAEEVCQATLENRTSTMKPAQPAASPSDELGDSPKRRSRKLSVDLDGNLNIMPTTTVENHTVQPLVGTQGMTFRGAIGSQAMASKPPGQDSEPRFGSEKLKNGVLMEIVDPTEQDSDIMERMGNGVFQGSDAASRVQLVSLGASCGPKLSFKDIGRGAETLPFDWSRTRIDALLHFIANGFAGFFDTASSYVKYQDKNGREWQAYRSRIHSFWHDDPYAPAMRERYTRRIHRFMSIDARSKPVLFVRSAAASTEIPRTLELLQLLMRQFGQQAKLLVVVEFQGPAAQGPCMISGVNNLLLWSFNTAGAPAAAAPHGGIVREALDWVLGLPIQAKSFPSLQAFQAIVKPTDWGLYGDGGVPAFV